MGLTALRRNRMERGIVKSMRERGRDFEYMNRWGGVHTPPKSIDWESKIWTNSIMVEEIVEILKGRGHTITMAESCTGGRVASSFTAISGVSSVFNGSCVSYSNGVKMELLGVRKTTLLEHGAVSEECVNEMLDGVSRLFNATGAIAVSGIAVPRRA